MFANGKDRMKILHVTETMKGGVGTYLNQLVPMQVARVGPDNIRVVGPAQHADQITDVDSDIFIGFERTRRSISSLFDLTNIIAHSTKTFRPDVIHAHSTFGGAASRLLFGWRRKRPAIVYCPHGWAFDIYPRGVRRLAAAGAENFLARLCDRIVAVSAIDATKGRRIGIADWRLQTILNGISATPPLPGKARWDDSRRKVLFIGRLDRQKGFDILDEAVAPLADRVVVRVAGASIVGGSDVQPKAKNIELLGWISAGDIEAQLRLSDLLVMASRWEGLPLVALEAMRASLPIIATRVGGIPEVVVDGVTGRLVQPDNVEALRGALLKDGHDARRQMGAAGYTRFEALFTADRVNSALFELYAKLVGERTRLTGNPTSAPAT